MWCSVHSDRGAAIMFIAEFRPSDGWSWGVALHGTITLPGF